MICLAILGDKAYSSLRVYRSFAFHSPGSMRNLESLPFSDRLHRIGYLLKHTVTVVGRDADIVTPWAWMVGYAVVMTTAFFVGVVGAVLQSFAIGAAGFGVAVAMFFYKYLFYNYREVGQSWLVYETISGRDRSYADAKAEAKRRKSGVWKLAGLDLLMAYLVSQRDNESKGIFSWLVNLFLAGLEEVWDLVNHYMLPAIAIDGLTLTDGVTKMKDLRNQVPETLTGVFGIDFIGRVVGQVTGALYFVLVLVAVGGSYFGAGVLPEAFTFTFANNPIGGGPLVLNVLPLIAGLYVGKVAGVIFERTVTSVKVIYFTIFYTQITHPDRIADDLRPQLVQYLRMEEAPTAPAGTEEVAPA